MQHRKAGNGLGDEATTGTLTAYFSPVSFTPAYATTLANYYSRLMHQSSNIK